MRPPLARAARKFAACWAISATGLNRALLIISQPLAPYTAEESGLVTAAWIRGCGFCIGLGMTLMGWSILKYRPW